jgi:hypothetical protein
VWWDLQDGLSGDFFGQVSDPLGEQSDLDFRGTGITLMFLKFTNYFLFTFRGEH